MAKKNLEKTSDAMKGVLAETIDDLTKVAKKSSNSLFTAILQQGAENVSDLLALYGNKLKKKVESHGKTNDTEN